MQVAIKKFASIALALTLVILPLQWFWLRIIELHQVSSRIDFVATQWYEGLIWLLAFASLAVWITTNRKLKLAWPDILALLLFAYAWLTLLWSGNSLSDQLIGLRFDLMAVYAYFLGRNADLTVPRVNQILTWVFWLVIGFGFLQLLLWWLAPGSTLVALGLDTVHRAVSVPQVYGSLTGPNQLGQYLLLAILLVYYRKLPAAHYLLPLLIGLLLFSISRSAILAGLIVGLLIACRASLAGSKMAVGSLLTVLLLILFGVIAHSALPQGAAKDVLTHGTSDTVRLGAVQNGINKITSSPIPIIIFGHGAGQSGPATFSRSSVFITENWYLETIYEYGVVGAGIFLAFLVSLIRSMWHDEPALTFGIIGLMVISLFLLPLGDSPAVVTTLFGLAGLAVARKMSTQSTK